MADHTVLYLEASVLVEALPNSVNPKLPISVKTLHIFIKESTFVIVANSLLIFKGIQKAIKRHFYLLKAIFFRI